MSQVKADDYVNSAGTGAPKFSKGIDLSQAAGYNKYATVAKSGDYTVTTTDGAETILVTAASNVTITLPAASGSTGRKLTFKKVDSGSGYVAIVRAGSDTIDGATTRYIPKQYDYLEIESDGTTWHIIKDFRHIIAEIKCNSNTTLTKATYTTLTNMSISSDSVGFWTSTSRLVIKEPGFYRISGQIRIETSFGTPPTFGYHILGININNSQANLFINSPYFTTISSYSTFTPSIEKYFNLNDYIELLPYAEYTGGSSVTLVAGPAPAQGIIRLLKI